jgi:hypothetical protein
MYEEYIERIKRKETAAEEVPKFDMKWNFPIRDPFDDEERGLFNSLDWLSQIKSLYFEIRWSLMEALSYEKEEKTIWLFRYYCENAIYRIFSLIEKIGQLVNDRCQLGMEIKEISFNKTLKLLCDKKFHSLYNILSALKNNAHLKDLQESYRHPKTHRREPYLKEFKNYRMQMTKEETDVVRAVHFGVTYDGIKWNKDKLKNSLVESCKILATALKEIIPIMYKKDDLDYEMI